MGEGEKISGATAAGVLVDEEEEEEAGGGGRRTPGTAREIARARRRSIWGVF